MRKSLARGISLAAVDDDRAHVELARERRERHRDLPRADDDERRRRRETIEEDATLASRRRHRRVARPAAQHVGRDARAASASSAQSPSVPCDAPVFVERRRARSAVDRRRDDDGAIARHSALRTAAYAATTGSLTSAGAMRSHHHLDVAAAREADLPRLVVVERDVEQSSPAARNQRVARLDRPARRRSRRSSRRRAACRSRRRASWRRSSSTSCRWPTRASPARRAARRCF